MNFELIIFDCDGVLVDSELISSKVLARIFQSIGLDMTARDVFDTLRGGSMDKTIRFVEEKIGGPIPIDLEAEYRVKSFEAYRQEMIPIPGVEDILRELNIDKCVGSNGPHSKIRLNLEVTGLDQYFESEHIFSAYDVDSWKPNPDLYLHAANYFKVDPTQCLVIEDSISGATAAQRAGMTCYGYARDTDPHLFVAVGAIPIIEMKEIKDINPCIFKNIHSLGNP